MLSNDTITNEDLDFFLTIISMFCEYNNTLHYSDRMFADITANPGKTKRIIQKLAEDGYITAVPHTNLPYRFTINMTLSGTEFQKKGGYKNQDFQKRKTAWISIFKSGWFRLLEIIASGFVGAAIKHFTDS